MRKNRLMMSMIAAVLVNLVFFVLYPMNFSAVTTEMLKIAGSIGLLIFVMIHGIRRYGWQRMSIFFAITFIISFSLESISVKTGFPFGYYHYTANMGVMLADVPLRIMPAYFFTGYLAWTLGTVFMKEFGGGIRKKNIVIIPVAASVIMVMWDFCFDPVLSTIEGNWIWENGGAYFGVPVSNFLGWFFTVYIIFQSFAFFLYRFGESTTVRQERAYWNLVPVSFIIQSIPYLLYPFIKETNQEIYQSMFLAAVFTMVTVSFLAILAIHGTSDEYFRQ